MRRDSGAWKPEKTCAICKKRFCVTESLYAYVRGDDIKKRYFCSWHCLREFDRTHENGGRKKPNEKKDAIISLRRQGYSHNRISLMLGISERMVKYYDDNYGGL